MNFWPRYQSYGNGFVAGDIDEKLMRFLFEHVDSVELIDVLLYLRSQAEFRTALNISAELRSSGASIQNRLNILRSIGLVEKSDSQPDFYRFHAATEELGIVAELLSEAYKVRKHKILEIVFSSSKRARPFADAFRIVSLARKKDQTDG